MRLPFKLKTKKIPGVCRALQVFSLIMFIFVLAFTLLSVVSSEKSLDKMTKVYVNSVKIDEKYFDGYKLYDFTDDMCRDLLEGERMKSLTAEVMKDRFMAIFHNTSSFSFTFEDSKSVIREEIERVSEGKAEVSEKGMDALVDYTADISGISTMYKFNTPAQYRTSIYDADRESIDFVNRFLLGLSKVSSPLFPLFMLLLYVLAVAMLIFLGEKYDISFSVANTAIYPSIAIFAFSLGEIFMPDASVVTDFIFKRILFISGAGILFGITILVVYRYLFVKEENG